MQLPSEAELARFFDEERAKDVQFVETVTSWLSLRILDFLYSNEPATTGDIARGLNMDMRDVKGRLEELEEVDIVVAGDDGWRTRTDRISVTVAGQDGVAITYSTAESTPAVDSPEGILTRLSRVLNPFS